MLGKIVKGFAELPMREVEEPFVLEEKVVEKSRDRRNLRISGVQVVEGLVDPCLLMIVRCWSVGAVEEAAAAVRHSHRLHGAALGAPAAWVGQYYPPRHCCPRLVQQNARVVDSTFRAAP